MSELFRDVGARPEASRWALESLPPRDLDGAWNTCHRGNWLVLLATRVGLSVPLVVAAICDCIEAAKPLGEPDANDLLVRPVTQAHIARLRAWGEAPASTHLLDAVADADPIPLGGFPMQAHVAHDAAVRTAYLVLTKQTHDLHDVVVRLAQGSSRHSLNTIAIEADFADIVRQRIPVAQVREAVFLLRRFKRDQRSLTRKPAWEIGPMRILFALEPHRLIETYEPK